jgi:MFS superfamily sulfate permease-like transporter
MKATLQQIQAIRLSSENLRSSFVVFLVALPLCLGIALASGAPASSGLIAGIVGGLLIGLLSPSEISVSGPAAGLTVVVLAGIKDVGSFEVFCLITAVAGLLQMGLGFLRFGAIGTLIPSSVIKGMLAAIGILIILKQIPHAVGFDADYFGDESFSQKDGDNTFSALTHAFSSLTYGAVIISVFSALAMFGWDRAAKSVSALKLIPAALIAVAGGILFNEFLLPAFDLQLSPEHLVQVPDTSLFSPVSPLRLMDVLFQWDYLVLAFTLCLIGSIETILSTDASEKLDPLKRSVDTSRELYAQGAGNIVSGLLGGLPITAVIVRTSANVSAGGTSRLSGILHALWILLFAVLAPALLNKIPLACLAVVLIFVGFKLTSPKLYKSFAKLGRSQFIPFVVTIVAILFTDLLLGVLIGFVVGLYFVFKANLHASVILVNDGNNYLLRFNKDTSFLNKPILKKLLASIPHQAELLIDGSRSVFIDTDIIDMIEDFVDAAKQKNIKIELRKSSLALSPFFKE